MGKTVYDVRRCKWIGQVYDRRWCNWNGKVHDMRYKWDGMRTMCNWNGQKQLVHSFSQPFLPLWRKLRSLAILKTYRNVQTSHSFPGYKWVALREIPSLGLSDHSAFQFGMIEVISFLSWMGRVLRSLIQTANAQMCWLIRAFAGHIYPKVFSWCKSYVQRYDCNQLQGNTDGCTTLTVGLAFVYTSSTIVNP